MHELIEIATSVFDGLRDTAIHLTSQGGRPNMTSASRLYAVFAATLAVPSVGLPAITVCINRTLRGKRSPTASRRL